jgi:formamidopyrimidine-DNA glycosylase
MPAHLAGSEVLAVGRRAKYLLLEFHSGTLILHLGMSGSLRLTEEDAPLRTHDHVIISLSSGRSLRLNDPRRFGCVLYQPGEASQHKLLRNLGVEPLGNEFSGAVLQAAARGRRVAVKNLLMDGRVVVGVGNIYASEALFRAGIRPAIAAGRVPAYAYDRLAEAVREVLAYAVNRGGTTLRDFLDPDGQPGYFAQELAVYGRSGAPCRTCDTPIKSLVLGGRSTFYCPKCQRSQGFRRIS